MPTYDCNESTFLLTETAVEAKPIRMTRNSGMSDSITDDPKDNTISTSHRNNHHTCNKNQVWKFDVGNSLNLPMISSPRFSLWNAEDGTDRDNSFRKSQARQEKNTILYDKIDRIGDTYRQNDMEKSCSIHLLMTQLEQEQYQFDQKTRQKIGQDVGRRSLSSNSTTVDVSETGRSFSSSDQRIQQLREEFKHQTNPISISVLYGIINATIVLPVIMSFGSIIYHDSFFRPYLPILIKLTVVSGIVHQLCFSIVSTLPFAVGQVQDAGLIFLSTIAKNIVKYCTTRGYTDEAILATTLIGLSLFTALLGLCLILIGRLQLASYVQKLPTPVIGGYLAYIGFFCGKGGISLMAAEPVDSQSSSHSGVSSSHHPISTDEKGYPFLLVLPGLLGGIFIYIAVRKIRHMAVLPICILSLLGIFYAVLFMSGTTLDQARLGGWIDDAESPPLWYHTWKYFNFRLVVWHALPGQIFTFISMVFVVALSTALDIAAIDQELPKPMEYNYELRMVGLSNLVSGLTGGYTGSYIFSQTIFSLRAGVRSRLSGYILALCQLVTVILPVSILSYVPNLFFGSLLLMICIDLMIEWLWDVRTKMSRASYVIAITTFGLIHLLGIENGIAVGTFIYLSCYKIGIKL